MVDFHALDAETRCVALVGQFLQHWAGLEFALSQCVAKLLNLDDIQSAFVNSNIQMRDKIHIVRTGISMARFSESDTEKFDGTLKALLDHLPVRNMMAHDMFLADDQRDGVKFLVTKAKGKLSFPDTRWSIAKFEEEFRRIFEHSMVLADLEKRLGVNALAVTLAGLRRPSPWDSSSEPTPRRGLLEILSPPPLPLRERHNSDTNPAIPKIENETPPSSEEKSQ